MNWLSFLSFFLAYNFVLLGVWVLRKGPRKVVNILAAVVNLCFAQWDFCYGFFYQAATVEEAWFWHRLSSIGWIFFCVAAVHFFFLVGAKDGARPQWWRGLLYLPPALLTAFSLWGPQTPVALGVAPDPGLGWSYVSAFGTPLWILHTTYLGVYFAFGLGFLVRWARAGRRRHLKQGLTLVALDVVILAGGFYTDMVAPAFQQHIPPLANFLIAFWMAGFWLIVRNFKLITVHEAASADLILETVMGPVLLLDDHGIVVQCNRATAELLNRPPEAIVGTPLSDLYRSGHYNLANVKALELKKRFGPVELELVAAGGTILHVMATFSLAETPLDGVVGIVVSLNDITGLKRVERELEVLANSDKLTGLPNRRRFFQRVAEVIAERRRSRRPFALVFTDLDGFKGLNDQHGHDVGDSVLITVAGRLRKALGPGDLVARVGGDEFVLLFEHPGSPEEFRVLLEALKRSIDVPAPVGNLECVVGLSTGVAWFPLDGESADDLMRAADQRMYGDKRQRNRIRSKARS